MGIVHVLHVNVIGSIVGRKRRTLTNIQLHSGAIIKISSGKLTDTREVEITGSKKEQRVANKLIREIVGDNILVTYYKEEEEPSDPKVVPEPSNPVVMPEPSNPVVIPEPTDPKSVPKPYVMDTTKPSNI